ncbi:MAG: four helix bundle protein [Saprospiraceae bacterium]|nr:four helix bundle protein [Candidatus Brachybacter algidus]
MVENYNLIFRQRTKDFDLKVILLLTKLKFSDALIVMRKQAIRSATSVAANYRAACRARSTKEKYSKICIVVEESDETQFWLEMLLESNYLPKNDFDLMYNEITEIVKVMTAFKKTLVARFNSIIAISIRYETKITDYRLLITDQTSLPSTPSHPPPHYTHVSKP